MNSETYLITALIIIGFTAVVWLLSKKKDTTLLEWAKTTQKDIKDLQNILASSLQSSNEHLVTSLQRSSREMNIRLDKATQVIGALKKEAGEFSEVSRSMQELNEFLRSPKLRGNIGEEVLKDLIGQMFPKNSFHLQYSFKSGAKVDAAIKTDAGILPIDSKFPMENFQRLAKSKDKKEQKIHRRSFVKDVKKHIKTISEKYILPEEGTMDFALMYIPSEAVYYEIANLTELSDYARKKRVYSVSPSTLYAHLQMILLSFEGKKIESKSKEIFTLLRAIQGDYSNLKDKLETLGSHIGNSYNKFSEVTQSFNLIGQKLESTKQLS
ncbi:MAG: DNA recombination protein RmuC [Candidatus Beckwithbacteria bacterium]|nr:DNA recombination protein RmuC [Patescibacteria group bacterium]